MNHTYITETFGLTPAETRVALAIIKGKGARAVARELKISWHTVRQHLKTIFDKTDTHRQSALVVLFMTPQLSK